MLLAVSKGMLHAACCMSVHRCCGSIQMLQRPCNKQSALSAVGDCCACL